MASDGAPPYDVTAGHQQDGGGGDVGCINANGKWLAAICSSRLPLVAMAKSLLPLLLCSVGVAAAAEEQTTEALQTLAAALVDLMRVCYVRGRHRRVFNFYAHAQVESNRTSFAYATLVDETLSRLWSNVSEPIATRLGSGQVLPGDHERHYSVLLVDSSSALEYLYGQLLAHHLHIGGFFIILLLVDHQRHAAELLSVFRQNWQTGIINVNVLLLVPQSQVLLYTAFPFELQRCNNFEPQLINRYEDGQWQRGDSVGDFYPGKLGNFHGCDLRCATWPEMPYLKVEQHQLYGLEGKLLEYLSARLNFTLRFYWLNEAQIAQTLDDKGAIFTQLFEAGIDFAIGAFRFKPTTPADPYAPSTPYFISPFRVITSAEMKPYSPYAKLLLPYEPQVWTLLAFSYLLAGWLCWLLRRQRRWRQLLLGAQNRVPMYNMWIICLGGGIAGRGLAQSRNLARYLLALWLAATLVLRSAYQAFIYHFIRSDLRQPAPSSVLQLLARNYTFVMSAATQDAVQQLPSIAQQAWLLPADFTNEQSLDRLRSAHEPLALVTAMEYFAYYRRGNARDAAQEFHVLPGQLLTQQLSIYMRRNSFMLARFDRYIMDYVNAGLMHKWVKVLLDQSGEGEGAEQGQVQLEQEPSPMDMQQLLGAFRLLLLGHACSLAVLLWEISGWAVRRLWHHLAINFPFRNATRGQAYNL